VPWERRTARCPAFVRHVFRALCLLGTPRRRSQARGSQCVPGMVETV